MSDKVKLEHGRMAMSWPGRLCATWVDTRPNEYFCDPNPNPFPSSQAVHDERPSLPPSRPAQLCVNKAVPLMQSSDSFDTTMAPAGTI